MKLSPTKTARNRTSAGLSILRSTSYMPQELAVFPTGGGVDRSARAGQAGTKWAAASSMPASAAMTAPQMPPSQIALLTVNPSSAPTKTTQLGARRPETGQHLTMLTPQDGTHAAEQTPLLPALERPESLASQQLR